MVLDFRVDSKERFWDIIINNRASQLINPNDPILKVEFKKIFDKDFRIYDESLSLERSKDGWAETQLWLNNRLKNSKDPVKWLLILTQYINNVHNALQSISFDSWNEKRLNDFNRWVNLRLEYFFQKVPSSLKRDREVLTIKQIALICFYKGIPVTKENAVSVAESYGRKVAGRLYDDYNHFTNATRRLSTSDSPTKFGNKIDLFNSILPYLENRSKDRALDDINTMKSKSHFV